MTELAAMSTSLSLHGFVRHPRPTPRGYREWLHVHVHDADVVLIVNVSLVHDPRVAAGHRLRVLLLARTGSTWRGRVDEASGFDVRGGQLYIDARSFLVDGRDGTLHLRGATRDGAIACDLTLVPETFASAARDVPVRDGSPIHWVVVPRLSASGRVSVADRSFVLDGARAYHDHNWGQFDHRDLQWRWGHVHGGARTLVLSSLLDRAGASCYLQTAMLWSGPRLSRLFRGDEVTVRPVGALRPRDVVTLPPSARLLAGSTTEVPRGLEIQLRAGGDWLEGTFEAFDLARIVVPELEDLRTTVIHEVVGRCRLDGRIDGARVAFDAESVFELLRAVQ